MHNRFLTNPYILYSIVWIFELCLQINYKGLIVFSIISNLNYI